MNRVSKKKWFTFNYSEYRFNSSSIDDCISIKVQKRYLERLFNGADKEVTVFKNVGNSMSFSIEQIIKEISKPYNSQTEILKYCKDLHAEYFI